ncbi:MAG: 6-pyruvoyl-tetrahydropterin synthase-related protein [Acidimicrobiales bacterium]|nr:6-pyruvoyl-tetrahydropterin synthase-related protein [Acidimicrobiales bacterium]
MRRPSPPALATFVAVGAVIVIVIWQCDPALLLANTMTTGGDTGAHFGAAAFLKSNLLPHFQVTGWFPGAYDGMPLNTFYFPLPDTLAALLGYVIPFDIAFKFVTILGSITLPVAAWAFGRLAGMERPRPAVLAAFTLPFLFDQTYTIYGGNLYSTMAGEYAFSLGLSVALVFLGVVVRGMRTGRSRVPAILLLSACVLCHLVPTLFCFVGAAAALVFFGPTRKHVWWMVSVIGTSFLLVAWWAVPFLMEQAYSTTMGWQNVTTFGALLAPVADRWALVVAFVGLVIACIRFDRPVLALAVPGIASALFVWKAPQGALYNTRVLPLWWLCVYLVAGYAVGEVLVLAARGWRSLRDALRWAPPPVPVGVVPGGATAAFATGGPVSTFTPHFVPGTSATTDLTGGPAGPGTETMPRPGSPSHDDDGDSWWRPPPSLPAQVAPRPPRRRSWAPGAVMVPLVALALSALVVLPPLLVAPGSVYKLGPVNVRPSNVSAWAQWNYSGVERKGGWPELQGIIRTMDKVTARYGCGRDMWEYNSNLNRFGTPMSLMLLPNYTGGCVDSMEGLFFESATSTPYHFIDQAELSVAPSEAMVPATTGITYGPVNVPLGIEHLQLLGVKYFMAASPVIQDQADADPALTLVATTGPWRTTYSGQTLTTTWKVYLIHNSSLVAPLTETPDVLTGVGADLKSWLPVSQRWYANPAEWSQQLVAGGPASWTEAPKGVAPAEHHALPAVTVTDVHSTDDQVSFHVSRTGVPVLVRVSYFPSWHATGALGPWRSEPNLMVVVPTSHHVTLTYGMSGPDKLGLALSVIGLVVLLVLVWRRFTFST